MTPLGAGDGISGLTIRRGKGPGPGRAKGGARLQGRGVGGAPGCALGSRTRTAVLPFGAKRAARGELVLWTPAAGRERLWAAPRGPSTPQALNHGYYGEDSDPGRVRGQEGERIPASINQHLEEELFST